MTPPLLIAQTAYGPVPLLRVRDIWGKIFYVNADRWNDGRTFLTAYKKTGVELWQRGKAFLSAQIYHRANIAEVLP